MTKRLVMMVGIPAQGKSSFCQMYAQNVGGIWVSRDIIRFKFLKKGDSYFSKEKEVYKEFVRQIKEGLDNDKEVYADATHITLASRTKLLRALGTSLKDCEVDAMILPVDLHKALKNNELRRGSRSYVPPQVIIDMAKRYETPMLEEGFDRLLVVV